MADIEGFSEEVFRVMKNGVQIIYSWGLRRTKDSSRERYFELLFDRQGHGLMITDKTGKGVAEHLPDDDVADCRALMNPLGTKLAQFFPEYFAPSMQTYFNAAKRAQQK
jgi:hypothetical protein